MRKMKTKELKDLITKTEQELRRREKYETAAKSIVAILKKNKVSYNDKNLVELIDDNFKKPRRRKVEAKYQDPETKKTWSGRGLMPLWVREVCERDNVTADDFKLAEKYRVSKTT